MKLPYFLKIFKSNYCKFVFGLFLIIISFLVPKKIFYGYYSLLGVLFIIFTALTITCFIRILKEKVYSAKSSGASILGILSIIFGFGALQSCVIGAPVCGATIGGGFISLIFPGFAFKLLEEYGLWIIIFSIFIQFFSLKSMNCFKLSCNEIKK